MKDSCKIQTGDWVGPAWGGPEWTPFAQGIADHYAVQVPWFCNELVTLAVSPTRQTTLTSPQQYDVLIFGAHVQSATASRLANVYLNITHVESGVPWAVPNIMPFFPITALAGVNVNAMPNLTLPEAFFLPAHTQLKLDWTLLGLPTFGTTTTVRLTLLGVQLTLPKDGKAPETVTMPNGQRVRPDGRLPLFMTIGIGQRIGSTFFFNNNQQRIQFLPPLKRDVEIHDLNSNVISAAFSISPAASSLIVKISSMGLEKQWTPEFSPLTAVFGGPGGGGAGATQVFPALPYCKPFLLPKGHRLQTNVQNTSDTQTYDQALLTFRGVQLGEY